MKTLDDYMDEIGDARNWSPAEYRAVRKILAPLFPPEDRPDFPIGPGATARIRACVAACVEWMQETAEIKKDLRNRLASVTDLWIAADVKRALLFGTLEDTKSQLAEAHAETASLSDQLFAAKLAPPLAPIVGELLARDQYIVAGLPAGMFYSVSVEWRHVI